jgi:hypothetical protein
MVRKPLEPTSFPIFSPGQQRAVLSFHHPNNKLLTKIWRQQNHFRCPFTYFSLRFVSSYLSQCLKPPPPCSLSLPLPSSPPHPTSPPRRRAPSPDGKTPTFSLSSLGAPSPVPPAGLRAAARPLPRRSEQLRQRQQDTQAVDGSQPPRRPAPSRRGVVHHGRVERAAGGAAVGAVLRNVRQRQQGLLRHRGARKPKRRRAPRRGGAGSGGALRVAPRQGHRRRRPPTGGHPVRHRVRAQEPLQVPL